MTSPGVLKAKVCVVGEAGVGKTSLVRRFVYGAYDGRYVPTLAAKVSRKVVPLRPDGRDVDVVLTIWDVMGEPSFLPLLGDAWFTHAQAILAVGDATRPETFPALRAWIATARRWSSPVPVLLAANKVDAPDARLEPAEAFSEAQALPWTRTSARTGKNVSVAFAYVAEAVARAGLARIREIEDAAIEVVS